MSYSIYKTEAIIMRVIPNGEANRDVVFLTRDLGKITARAQAARKIESKMRMQLSRYNHVVIDVVHGKTIWRLTGIHQVATHRVFGDNFVLHAWHRAIGLAEHLIRGEEAHPELFDFFAGIMNWVDTYQGDSAGLELFLVIHVLQKLGYWSGESVAEIPDETILKNMNENKKELVAKINESIEATQIV
ncbi:MAG: repair protein RecO, repair protein RecO [Patescibacteria group bacterium]|nr:repair protein RecO, repair protein RecO [Patescibacteria group bacterium]